ncbi:MAG: DUF296 domain-containing protein [Desulfobacterales bacterium]|jgi:predicted DNA-binding protein with PD1-like motif
MFNNAPMAAELAFGRVFLGSLSGEADLFHFLQRFCRKRKIRAGVFSFTGTTRYAIIGTFDPSLQVYATRKETGSLDVIYCTGTILPKGDDIAVTAQILLRGENRAMSGGRLFPETPVDEGEFELRELVGTAPERIFDPVSGRSRLRFLESTNRARGNRTPEAGNPPRQK